MGEPTCLGCVRLKAALLNEATIHAERIRAYYDLQRQYERAMRALESLTPGGSEYVNDPERCVAYVRETRQSQHRALVEFKRRADRTTD